MASNVFAWPSRSPARNESSSLKVVCVSVATRGADLVFNAGRVPSCRRSFVLFLIAILSLFNSVGARPASAQEPAASQLLGRALRVFIDCRGPGCDQEFFRRELTWVDHMRDQKDADVHILVTTRGTGGGGTEYRFRFIGHGQWEGQEDGQLRTAEAGETEDARRRALVQAFALGLARFASATPAGRELKVTTSAAAATATQTTAADDPWNYWVFRTNVNINVNGEATSESANVNVNQSANRTTAAWKVNLNTGYNLSESRYDLEDGERFVSTRRGWNLNGIAVKSLSDHWSAAAKAGVSRSTFLNTRRALRAGAGVEYNVFPYDQSTERSLIVQWTAGISTFHYDEITIYDQLRETRWDEAIIASLDLRQPFGSIGFTTEFAHYLDDVKVYRFAINADADVRLTRGFSFRVDGNYQLVHDQLYLKRGEATNEEIIARQRQLATSFRYFAFVGITYRFGSINNNVVNPRFGTGPGGF